jgi:murein DD-endopeptidase MepM/ murein hydrolase activator NlpD
MRQIIAIVLAVSALLVLVTAVAWLALRKHQAAPQFGAAMPPIAVSPAPQPTPTARLSTIIDLPGDPALVRRAALKAPRPLTIAAPVLVTPGAPQSEAEAFYVSEPLAPPGGGYLGKFTGNGQEADALNAELAVNSAQGDAVAQDAGDDDDGGDMTPQDAAPAAPLTGANTQQLDAVAGGENGRPQLKETFLRPKVAQKLSELLIESGYEETSALAVEAAAKRLYNIQSLRPGSVALAVGAVDLSGAYRMAQLTMFQDGEYVGTVALTETGRYEEGAEPKVPPNLLDDSDQTPPGAHFTLADGVYSAALRSATPEPVAREAVRLLQRLVDLDAPLGAGETLRLLYARTPRSKLQPASRVVYAGLAGPLATVDCYAFELSDGTYRCFTQDDAAPLVAPLPPAPQEYSQVPLPPERNGAPSPPERTGGARLADSGAAAVGGLLAPIRGAPITSLFGMRFHPILHIVRLHAGIDFGAPVGSQVRAAVDGVVESTGPARGYGDRVVLKHNGFETTYNHLSEIRVEVGARVRQGEIIALSGNSGLSTGPHLHFEYRINGDPVDPLPHMGREVQGRLPAAVAEGAPSQPSYMSVPVPAAPVRPPPPDPAVLAAFAAAKAEIDAVLAEAER